MEVRRIFDDFVSKVSVLEDQSKKENNNNLTGKQVAEENDDYLELYSDYLY